MSRPIGVIEQEAPTPFIDREALMMDGGPIYFQLTQEDDSGDEEFNLSNLVGQTLIDPTDGFRGVLRAIRSRGSGNIIAYELDAGGSPRRSRRLRTGVQLVTGAGELLSLASGAGNIPSVLVPGRLLNQDERENLGLSFAAPSGGSTGSTAFSSTQAAQTQDEAFRREQDRLDREFREEQNRLDREEADRLEKIRAENARRISLMDSLTLLARSASEKQTELLGLQQAFDLIVAQTQGDDPIRAAILGQGQVQRGRTPAQAQRANVGRRAEHAGTAAAAAGQFTTPNLSADIAGLESQVTQTQDVLNEPIPTLPTPPVFGLEHGGEVVKAGKDEPPVRPFSERPDPMTAFRFAEQMGLTPLITGEREGGPELVLAAKGTKVIPLNDEEESLLVGRVQGAEHGADVLGDFSTVEQALSPIFENLGFSSTPLAFTGPAGGTRLDLRSNPGGLSPLGLLNTLSVQPRLFRSISIGGEAGLDPANPNVFGHTFFIDESGQRRIIPGGHRAERIAELGFDPADVIGLAPSDIRTFTERGESLTEAPPLIEGGVSKRRFPLSTRPLTVPFPGGPNLVLPAARTLASIFRNLSSATRNVILSAFGVAGQNEQSFLEELSFFTPKGSARAAGAATFG